MSPGNGNQVCRLVQRRDHVLDVLVHRRSHVCDGRPWIRVFWHWYWKLSACNSTDWLIVNKTAERADQSNGKQSKTHKNKQTQKEKSKKNNNKVPITNEGRTEGEGGRAQNYVRQNPVEQSKYCSTAGVWHAVATFFGSVNGQLHFCDFCSVSTAASCKQTRVPPCSWFCFCGRPRLRGTSRTYVRYVHNCTIISC